MKRLLTLTICLIGALAIAQVSPREKQALIDLYHSTEGENWINTWDINEPVTTWQGVTVENNTITELRLMFNNIKGELPETIGNLKNLRILEMSFNKINGDLPTTLRNLNKLEVLAFNGNEITGTIPASIGEISNLKQLHLSSNKLTGSVPDSMNNLSELEVFNVFDNNLSGTLPHTFATHRHLTELMVAENNFKDTQKLSIILLSNSSGLIDLDRPALSPSAQTVIASKSSDDDN